MLTQSVCFFLFFLHVHQVAWWDSVCRTILTSESLASLAPRRLANRSWKGEIQQVNCLYNAEGFIYSSLFCPAAVLSVTWRRSHWSWEENPLWSSSVTVTWTRLSAWWANMTRQTFVTSLTAAVKPLLMKKQSRTSCFLWYASQVHKFLVKCLKNLFVLNIIVVFSLTLVMLRSCKLWQGVS